MVSPAILIRRFKPADYFEIAEWWEQAQEPGPEMGAMVEDGTFVLEIDGVPSMTLTVFLTQSKQVAFLEGFIARPGIEKSLRRRASEVLFNYACQWADSKGYRTVIMYAGKPGLVERYEALGMNRAQSGLTALYRSL